MDETSPRLLGPTAALALAAGAFLLLAAGDALMLLRGSAETIFTLTWLLGWVLLVWAVILAGGCLVILVRRIAAGRSVTGFESGLLCAAIALAAAAAWLHPLWGSGVGYGG